jgi:hypothetical protein
VNEGEGKGCRPKLQHKDSVNLSLNVLVDFNCNKLSVLVLLDQIHLILDLYQILLLHPG